MQPKTCEQSNESTAAVRHMIPLLPLFDLIRASFYTAPLGYISDLLMVTITQTLQTFLLFLHSYHASLPLCIDIPCFCNIAQDLAPQISLSFHILLLHLYPGRTILQMRLIGSSTKQST